MTKEKLLQEIKILQKNLNNKIKKLETKDWWTDTNQILYYGMSQDKWNNGFCTDNLELLHEHTASGNTYAVVKSTQAKQYYFLKKVLEK